MTLLSKLSALTGPDRELDALIFRVLANAPAENHWYEYNGDYLSDGTAPRVTASIDAAMMLAEREQLTDIVHEAWQSLARKYALHCNHWPEGVSFQHEFARAICIAALKARDLT